MIWKTSRREITFKKTLVMAVLNVTPDSFSDGGKFSTIETALSEVEHLIEEGADIIDIGGESTRPNSRRVSVEEEINRVIPIIEVIAKKFDIPISIDTSKSRVAEPSINAGAEIINDVSGLRFDKRLGEIAAKSNSGLILMHLRGDFETMHRQEPIGDILEDIKNGLHYSVEKAESYGVEKDRIILDVGIGFSKTLDQNLELIAKLDVIYREFADFPILIGASRKSFIGKVLGDVPVGERLYGSLASAAIAVWNGAKIVRVHDVKATVELLRVVDKIKSEL